MKTIFWENHSFEKKGQGALEYLLLIGGAVLVATIVLLFIFQGAFPATEAIINQNLDTYINKVGDTSGFGGGGGGLGWTCNNGTWESALGEVCDGTDPTNTGCSGIQICNASCTACINPSVCSNSVCEPGEDPTNCPTDCSICGDGLVTALEFCDTSGNVNCSGATPVCQAGCGACVAAGPPNLSLAGSPGYTLADLSWSIVSNFEPGSWQYQIKGGQGMDSMLLVTDKTSFDAFSTNPLMIYDSGLLTPAASGWAQATGLTTGVIHEFKMLACNSAGCSLSATTPVIPEVCGDNTKNGPELCDGLDLGGTTTCSSFNPVYTSGTLQCNSTCNGYDASLCVSSLYLEAENANTIQTGLISVLQSGAQAVRPSSQFMACNSTTNDIIYSAPTIGSGTYYVWARVQNTTPATPLTFIVSYNSGVVSTVTVPGSTSVWTWIQGAPVSFSSSGPAQVNGEVQCNIRLFVDQFLFTTSSICNPAVATC